MRDLPNHSSTRPFDTLFELKAFCSKKRDSVLQLAHWLVEVPKLAYYCYLTTWDMLKHDR
jgi:hypothetical protein